MKRLLSIGVAVAVGAAVAGPSAVVTSVAQDPSTRVVTVNYTLSGAPAIVTFDFLTNGVSIGGANVTGGDVLKPQPRGDVFRRVTTDGAHAFTWKPDRTWSDHLADGQIAVSAWAMDNPPDYLAVPLETNVTDGVRFYPDAAWVPGGILSNFDYRTTVVLMRRIHAKDVTWTMGTYAVGTSGTPADNSMIAAEERMHEVALTNDYYMGVFETTASQYAMVGGPEGASVPGSYFVEASSMRPVVGFLNYHLLREATNNAAFDKSSVPIPQYQYPNPPSPDTFLGRLRTISGLPFDLPSEAQWEFAARGGHGDGYWPDGSAWNFSDSREYESANVTLYCKDENLRARYWGDCGNESYGCFSNGTQVVGSYAPNGFGLYDMIGNAAEWCLDYAAADITALNGAVNANGAYLADGVTLGTRRVRRGGSFDTFAYACRPSYRCSKLGNGQWYSKMVTAAEPYGNRGDNTTTVRLCCTADLRGLE